ncbi:CASP-like protein 1D1 [Eucalyptus grandis]|uniref:CASP-like protein 1D1 n=1 Tax=Eucalyptus grandis TaxID=71139 RepID=UPI0005279AEE|nr:CASP-like protein 1D1 [Eucalyptus grandis]
MMRRQRPDQLSSVLRELSALTFSLLRSPPAPAPFSDDPPPPPPVPVPPPSPSAAGAGRSPAPQMTPAGFASLMLGLSLALMLCGSVTFFIGFVLMPWVLGLVMVLYVAGIVSTLSVLGRSVLCFATASPARRKDMASWKLL